MKFTITRQALFEKLSAHLCIPAILRYVMNDYPENNRLTPEMEAYGCTNGPIEAKWYP